MIFGMQLIIMLIFPLLKPKSIHKKAYLQMKKKNYDILIATTSWEQRFLLGVEKNLVLHDIDFCLLFSNESNPHLTETNLNIDTFKSKKIFEKYRLIDIDFGSTLNIWQKLSSELNQKEFESKKVLIDITTTPREIIWYTIYFLKESKCEISYIYHKPQKYTSDWLTKDPRKPRFIIKHSGISEFGKPTGLFILTGFDHNRTEQLINFYEPKLILLGVQKKNILDTDNRNAFLHENLIKQFKD